MTSPGIYGFSVPNTFSGPYSANTSIRFPASFRAYVQTVLTFCWELRAPVLQPASPATLVARTLQRLLGRNIPSYTFVDFCSGAGGPIPSIERKINASLQQEAKRQDALRHSQLDGHAPANEEVEEAQTVDFLMTDIHPHLSAWRQACKTSENLRYVPAPVDAASAPKDLLQLAGSPTYGNTLQPKHNRKVFRLFCLAFHHFDDEMAVRILQNTLATSSGFAIFELQGRDLGNLFTVLMLGPLLWLGSWYWFWGSWSHLFWTYCVPIVPFVVVYDGMISCLRTRSKQETISLINQVAEADKRGRGRLIDDWRFDAGGEMHTWPGGKMQYFVGVKD